MTEIQNSKRPHHLKKREFQYMFGSLSTCPVECRLLAALLRRIPQGENLRFVCNLVLVFWDFINSRIKERPTLGSALHYHLVTFLTRAKADFSGLKLSF
jgi:hypothetical protein